MEKNSLKILFITLIPLLSCCEGEQGELGPSGLNSLIKTTEELSSDNCPNGGYRIETGIDINKNDILDSGEIQTTEYICNGNSDSDNELRFGFNFSGSLSFETTNAITIDGGFSIPSFNINNFYDVDSVSLGAILKSNSNNTHCILELVDLTNDNVIANSSVSTNSTSELWVISESNFFDQFPNESIDLGLRLTSDNGASVMVKNPLLFLYRK